VKSRPKLQQTPVRRIPVHELFPQPDSTKTRFVTMPTPQTTMKMTARHRRTLPRKNILLGLAFLTMVLTGFGLFGFLRRSESQTPYVLLEIRALEASGHPVTAADVIVNDKKMGVTDSFGEWRRYLQLRSGEKVAIALDKKGQLTGSKQVVVPERTAEKQDIELAISIAMKGLGKGGSSIAKSKATNRRDETAAATESSDGERFDFKESRNDKGSAREKEKEKESLSDTSTASDDKNINSGLSDTNDSALGIYFDDGLNRISVGSSTTQAKPANLMDKRQQDVVHERIVPVLVNDLQSLGLSVDKNSPWKLQLSYISNGEQVGYIRAEIEWHSPFGQTEKSSFIAGFAKTYEETGRALSSLLRLHMKKTYWAFKENGNWYIDEAAQTKDFWRLKAGASISDTSGEKFPLVLSGQGDSGRRWKLKIGKTQPCEAVRQRSRCMVSTESLKESPPLPGWVQKRIRILGPVPPSAAVYVAGFQAHPIGNNQWEFWSHSGSNLKALILASGRIVHSEAFVDSPGEAVILKMAGTAAKNKVR